MALRKPYALAFGFTLLGFVAGHYLWPRPAQENFHVADTNADGNLDLIVDNNWGIILTNDRNLIQPEDTLDQRYKICLFPKETAIPFDPNTRTFYYAQAPSLLKDCLRD